MKKTFSLWLSFLLVLAFTSLAWAQGIRVGIVNGQRSAAVQIVAGSYSLESAAGQKLKDLPSGESFLLSSENNSLYLNDEQLNSPGLLLRPQAEEAELQVNKRRYRGSFRVQLVSPGSLQVVNVLAVEDYLAGSVPAEIQPLWPEEASKAQIITSRTIAYQALRSNQSRSYDLLAMDKQGYYGKEVEQENITRLIKETQGLVVIWQNAPIEASFFSASGGRTEEGNRPYLVSVLDYDLDSPDFTWERIYTAKEIDSILKYGGYEELGSLRGFEFSPLDLARLDSFSDRGKSGRLKTVKILGERGFVTLAGEKFAQVLGLPSSAFDLAIDNILPESVDIPITDRYGNVIGVKKMPVAIKSNVTFPPNRAFTQRVSWAENETIIIRGRGRGHGLGLSQWGARGLALEGKSAQEILSYYFPGTALYRY